MRIVSLCPSITESLIDLGLAAHIVGITRFCIHPREVVAGLTKVGGTKTPDLEKITALAPDLILMNEEENRREDFLALSARFRVESSFPRTVADVPAQLRRLGALTGTEAIAGERAQVIETGLRELDAARALHPEARFRFAYLIWRDPYMSVSGDTYVSDLLARGGGVNVFAGHKERYPTLSLTELAAAKPEHVLLSDEPFPFEEKHAAELRPELPGVTVELVSGDDCSWHGVRSIRGLALVKAFLERATLRAR